MAAASILFFDLNHCNAMQQNPVVLFEEHDLVVLDHTSATTAHVHFYLKEAFQYPRVRLVLLVTSGVKNEQAGADLNSYGTLRIVARSKQERDDLLAAVKDIDRLYDDTPYRHPKESHAVRRAFKNVGLVPTTRSFLRPGFTPPTFNGAPTMFQYAAPDRTLTFEVLDVPADGDCLFTAIASVTGRYALEPAPIRKRICSILSDRMDLVPDGMYLQVGLGFSGYRVRDQARYLARMRDSLVWGGRTEIPSVLLRSAGRRLRGPGHAGALQPRGGDHRRQHRLGFARGQHDLHRVLRQPQRGAPAAGLNACPA